MYYKYKKTWEAGDEMRITAKQGLDHKWILGVSDLLKDKLNPNSETYNEDKYDD